MAPEMEKLKVLLIVLVTAAAGLAFSMFILALSIAPNESPLNVLGELMTGGFSPNLTILIPLSTLLFLFTLLASVVGVIYFLVLPEMKDFVAGTGGGKEAASVVMRTLKPEERKVVLVLDAHGGTYLQKYITKEAGLSRLKTHRVIASLSERGIVRAEKRGNTNEVTLVQWFHEGMHR
jgi:uncharacterized membrane protein